MSFEPSLPDDSVNVSRTHPLREAATLIAGVAILGVVLAVVIGVAIDWIAPRIPPSVEFALFSGWLDEPDGEPDPREAAVAELLARVARHWPENEHRFRVLIWDDAEPNALALPGGGIAVTTGLLDAVGSENELAFVLGHELGHFRNRDHLRGMGRSVAFSLSLFAIGMSGGGSAAQLAGVAGEFTRRGFSRRQETLADRFGLELVAAEYGHTAGATDLFEHLRATGDSALDGYLSTHPLHGARIGEIEATARAAGWPLTGPRRALAAALRAPRPDGAAAH